VGTTIVPQGGLHWVVELPTSDIVVILRGSIGTLNQFTIAYDLEGTGGVADHMHEFVHVRAKKTQAALFFERDAVELLRLCLVELARRRG
jgi:hypothetical protein